jgi:2-keto-4-pentenoate hydratase/2-oxohepta-3-ene-1,7-dioic acid hydratase in catechol pathway
MVFTVARIIRDLSAGMSLVPGDIIITGTPEGVSPIQPGDVIEAYVEKIGAMEVKVRAA